MFKRLLWLVVGAAFGFGLSFWLTRMVRRTVERYTPARISSDLAAAIRGLGQDLRDAVSEGREAMREHEAALRADLAMHDGRDFAQLRPPEVAIPPVRRRPLRAVGR